MIFNWVLKFLTGEVFQCNFSSPSPPPAPPSQPTKTEVTNTTLPEYARPYVENTLGQAQALTNINNNPYQSYQGERTAGFTPMQQKAQTDVGNMQVAPQVGQGSNLAGAAGIGSLQAGSNYIQQATNPNAVQAYMSPYIQNTLQPQLEEMQRQYGITGQQEKGRATAAGAFGGTRQALMQSENERNKNMAMNQAIGQGYQSAFDRAQQAQQYGANLGLQGYSQAMQGASTLGQLGQNQYGQQMGINAAQQQVGAQQQALNQQNLSNQYQEFLNQQNYPYKQLGFMSDIIRGSSLSGGSSSSMYQAPPNMMGQVAGLGLGLGSMLSGYGKATGKEGGDVRGFAEGGGVAGIGANTAPVNYRDPSTELGLRSLTAAAQQGKPQPMSLEQLAFLNKQMQQLHTPQAAPQNTTVAEDIARKILMEAQAKRMQEAQAMMPQQAPQQMQQQMPQQMQQDQQAPQQAPQQGIAQPPQQQPMAHGGLTSLPVHNFNPDNYAHGGIVAFTGGGTSRTVFDELAADTAREPLSAEDAAQADAAIRASTATPDETQPVDTSGTGMLARALESLQTARTKMPSRTLQAIRDEQTGVEEAELKKLGIGALGADRTKKLEELAKQDPERRSEALRNFLMSAGFNMAAEASQYGRPQSGGLLGSFLQPAALGASKALPGYLADQKELRALTAARDKELAEITDRRRTEALSGVRTSQGTKDKEDARIERMDEKILAGEIELAKSKVTSETARLGRTPSDLTIVANNYLQARRDLNDKRSDAVIKQEGINEHVRLKASYDPRFAGIAATQQTAAEAQDAAAQRAALTAMTARLREPDALINRMDLRDKDEANKKAGKPSTLEADYVRGIYDDAYNSVRRGSATPAPAAAPAAAAAPAPRAAPAVAQPSAPSVAYNKVQGAPAGGSYGQYVPGKGWEIKSSDGKLVGYAQ
jgi:hypothetical protein